MNTVPRYRSGYTGREIDEILASVKNKLDASSIVNDFEQGGADLVASAELAKILHQDVVRLQDPNYFHEILSQIPDFNMFTDEYKNKLDGIDDRFKGIFLNAADRDANLETINFIGGELTFLLDDGSESKLNEWSIWNNLQSRWIKANFVDLGTVPALDITAPGNYELMNADAIKNNTWKICVTYMNVNALYSTEMSIFVHGADVVFTRFNTILNGIVSDPLTFTFLLANGRLRVMAATASTNAQIRVKKIVEM